MPLLPDHHVRRPRLTALLAEAPLVLVEAGSGYGKSGLAAEHRSDLDFGAVSVVLGLRDAEPPFLARTLLRGVRAAGLARTAARMDAADDPEGAVAALLDGLVDEPRPVLLVVDDVHHAAGAGAALLAQLAVSLPEPHRLLLLGRWLPGPMRRLRHDSHAVVVDGPLLALVPEEVEQLCREGFGVTLSTGEAAALHHATAGWTALAVLAARRLATDPEPGAAVARIAIQPSLLAFLLEEALGQLDAGARAGVLQLAHLPLITAEVARAVSPEPDLLALAADAGLPFTPHRDGRWELPAPVAEHLARLAPLDPEAATRVARVYSRAGDALRAVDLLVAAGCHGDAAALLADLEPRWLDRLDVDELEDAVAALPEAALDEHPRALLHVARADEPAARLQRRTATLRRVLRVAVRQSDEPLAREVDAELARDLIRDGHAQLAASVARAVLDGALDGETSARLRALDALGRAAAWRGDDAALSAAEPLLEDALRGCRQEGQLAWAAQVAMPLAVWVYYPAARYERAIALIDGALHDLPIRGRHRAVALTFRADFLDNCGRYDEATADLAEARDLAALTGDERGLAYAAWESARNASQQGDAAAAVAAIREVERHLGDWFTHATGAEFLADAADLLDRVGERALARSYLERAQERAQECPLLVAVAEAALAARSGDPATALSLLERVRGWTGVVPRERWRLALLRAYAASRQGDPRAGALAASAFDQAAALGEGLPFVREQAIADRLVGLAASSGSGAAARLLPQRNPPLTVTLLGGFELARGGQRLDPPPGQPAEAVKIVAAAGGSMPVEALIECLWPEVEPATGHKRLRNVLARLHAACGDVLERRGGAITLVAGAEVDAEAFESAARQALAASAAGERSAAQEATSAVARYRGDALPGDPYADWAAVPRERWRRLRLRLLDLLAADAEQRGEVDEALDLLERCLEMEPEEEDRYLRAARLLLDHGRPGQARGFLRRAHAALAALGLQPSSALVGLERRAAD